MKENFIDQFTDESIVYTSGTGAIFKSGIPIGKVNMSKNEKNKNFNIDFFTDFSQLKYVFAEVVTKNEIKKVKDDNSSEVNDPMTAKLKILEDELQIVEQSNIKFKEENESLKNKIFDLNNEISGFRNEILIKNKTINQFDIDKSELEFLRMNLSYGHKCRKSFFNTKGFLVGSADYKSCVLNRGKINNE